MDISASNTKVNGRPKGRPSKKHTKGALEFPEKKRIPFVSKLLHALSSVEFRKATYSRSPIGFKGN